MIPASCSFARSPSTTNTFRQTLRGIYSPKTSTLTPLVASITTSSFARFAPDRDGIHEARTDDVLPVGLTQNTVQSIKSAAAKAIFGDDVKATLNDIQNHIKTNTRISFFLPSRDFTGHTINQQPSAQRQCSGVRNTGSRHAHRPASR